MRITVCYMAQLKQLAGTPSESVELNGAGTVLDLVQALAERHGEGLRRLLFAADGSLNATNLYFVGDKQVQASERVALTDGAVVTVLSPIAGGSL